MKRARVLILWNQVDDDVVELWRRDDRQAPDWDPAKIVEPWETITEEIDQITEAIRLAGHDCAAININDDFELLLAALQREQPDAVMNLIEWFHDDPEHEMHVPALFELAGIAYTGSRPLALSLCQKKPHAKALLAAHGLSVPRGVVLETPRVPPDHELSLRYPLIVKPAFDDASGGIDAGSVVNSRSELEARVALVVGEHEMPALVEEFIAGREIHCAILGNEPPLALPLYEMQFKRGGTDDEGRPLPGIITYKAKWDPYSRDHYAMESKCPIDDLSPEVVQRINGAAIRAFQVLGCRDYARVDMRLHATSSEPFVLEVNPNPDLADGCAFSQCVRASGRSYAQVIQNIVGFALQRAERNAKRKPAPSEDILRDYLKARRKTGR